MNYSQQAFVTRLSQFLLSRFVLALAPVIFSVLFLNARMPSLAQSISQKNVMSSDHYTLAGTLGGMDSINSSNSIYQIESSVGQILPTTTKFIWGDLNGDGKAGIDDVQFALRAAVGAVDPTIGQDLSADVMPVHPDGRRGDGVVNLADVIFLLRLAVGLETL